MNLYLANGRYVGTQAEAWRADRNFKPVDVPTDKPGLIAYLNELAPAPRQSSAAAPPMAAEQPSRDMSAGAVLARSDNPGLDVDGIVEAIISAKGIAAGRFATAVAIAFQNIAGGK